MRDRCNVNHQLSNESNDEGTDYSKEIINLYANPTRSSGVPFLALWTPIMNNKTNIGVEIRQSNATVESWFKTVKVDILDGDRMWKCGRFLKLMRQRSRQITTKVNGKRKISAISSHNHLEAIESWGKKDKQHKYLQPMLSVCLDSGACGSRLRGDRYASIPGLMEGAFEGV
ncbi:Uncharacterized protein FWK35_00024763, partial [Aphis craccivora]